MDIIGIGDVVVYRDKVSREWGLLLGAPIKTGNKYGMKVSYGEGLSIHISPESWKAGRSLII